MSSTAPKVWCPACGRSDTRRSRPGGLKDAILRQLGRVPWRCRGCGRRFYRPVTHEDRIRDGEEVESRGPSAQ